MRALIPLDASSPRREWRHLTGAVTFSVVRRTVWQCAGVSPAVTAWSRRLCVFTCGSDWTDTHWASAALQSESLRPPGSNSFISPYSDLGSKRSKTQKTHQPSARFSAANLHLLSVFLHSLLNSETLNLTWRNMLNNGISKKDDY